MGFQAPESDYQRVGVDRRQRKLPSLKYIVFGGRRSSIRRREDSSRFILLDRYGSSYLAYILVILSFSLIDGFFTLYLIQNGADEAIPYWDLLIEHNQFVYLILKYSLTALGCVLLLVSGDVYVRPFKIQFKRLFPVLIAIYASVILWQFLLYFRMSKL